MAFYWTHMRCDCEWQDIGLGHGGHCSHSEWTQSLSWCEPCRNPWLVWRLHTWNQNDPSMLGWSSTEILLIYNFYSCKILAMITPSFGHHQLQVKIHQPSIFAKFNWDVPPASPHRGTWLPTLSANRCALHTFSGSRSRPRVEQDVYGWPRPKKLAYDMIWHVGLTVGICWV